MSWKNDRENSKRLNYMLVYGVGLYFFSFLMWIFGDYNATAVLLTGAAALTLIISSYQKKAEQKSKLLKKRTGRTFRKF
jgi:hypothetical protein